MRTLPEMPCAEFVERVTDYLEDRIAADDRVRFDEHLAECRHCVQYLEQLRTTLRIAGRLREDDFSTAMKADLMQAFRDRGRA